MFCFMNVYNQKELNALTNYTVALFNDGMISALTSREKKIAAVALFLFYLITACYLSFKIFWPTKNTKVKPINGSDLANQAKIEAIKDKYEKNQSSIQDKSIEEQDALEADSAKTDPAETDSVEVDSVVADPAVEALEGENEAASLALAASLVTADVFALDDVVKANKTKVKVAADKHPKNVKDVNVVNLNPLTKQVNTNPGTKLAKLDVVKPNIADAQIMDENETWANVLAVVDDLEKAEAAVNDPMVVKAAQVINVVVNAASPAIKAAAPAIIDNPAKEAAKDDEAGEAIKDSAATDPVVNDDVAKDTPDSDETDAAKDPVAIDDDAVDAPEKDASDKVGVANKLAAKDAIAKDPTKVNFGTKNAAPKDTVAKYAAAKAIAKGLVKKSGAKDPAAKDTKKPKNDFLGELIKDADKDGAAFLINFSKVNPSNIFTIFPKNVNDDFSQFVRISERGQLKALHKFKGVYKKFPFKYSIQVRNVIFSFSMNDKGRVKDKIKNGMGSTLNREFDNFSLYLDALFKEWVDLQLKTNTSSLTHLDFLSTYNDKPVILRKKKS